MNPHTTINLLRTLFATFATSVGVLVGDALFGSSWSGGVAGLALGLTVVLADRLLEGVSLRIFSSATIGLLIGFIFAQLLLASNIFYYLDEDLRWVLSLIVYAVCGYIGTMLAMRSNRDEFALIIPYVRFRQSAVHESPLLLDTNIVIDGRIADVCATGFLSGSLVVPRFVLDELQRLADSNDPIKRERGRRGLDSLALMQKSPQLVVTIHEAAAESGEPVDSQLIQLAKNFQARLLSNDANLCRIARLQSVPVLNLNELAKAMRPSHATGDELEITLVKEGRDSHQAVGYLPDGTMVVVNHARQQIGSQATVTVSSTVQTSAGRMIFAELTK